MMKLFLIIIVTHVITSICAVQPTDSSHVLHGLFSDSNPSQIYYGTFDLDTLQFINISSLSINDVGNPNCVKYSVLPLTYNPLNDVLYMAAPDNENVTILSVISATNGKLISTFKAIIFPIISLQYDIFSNKLFGIIATTDMITHIVEIDTTDGTVKNPLTIINNLKATPISSYSPVSKQYFFMMIDDQHQQYQLITLNTTTQNDSASLELLFSPISMRLDYKSSTMYMTYPDEPDKFISSLGILDRSTGDISKFVTIIAYNSSLAVAPLSAYDIAQNIYYLSYQLTESNLNGIAYVDVDASQITLIPLPEDIVKSHGWFVKQFANKRKFI